MKKFLSLTLAVLLVFSCFGSLAMAEEKPITVTINGVLLTFDVQPQIVNDRTLVPIRAISEYLGYQVSWTQANQQIDIKDAETAMVMHIGSADYTVNDVSYTADVAPQIISDRTFVPLRLIGETFNAEVSWNAPERAVIIKVDLSTDVPFETTGSYVNGKDYRAMGITGFVPATGTVTRETAAGTIQGDATLFQPVSEVNAIAMIEAYNTELSTATESQGLLDISYENITEGKATTDTIEAGDLFYMNVALNQLDTLAAAQFILNYDPETVSIVSATGEAPASYNDALDRDTLIYRNLKFADEDGEEYNVFSSQPGMQDYSNGTFSFNMSSDIFLEGSFRPYQVEGLPMTLVKIRFKALKDGDAGFAFNIDRSKFQADFASEELHPAASDLGKLVIGEGVSKAEGSAEKVQAITLSEIPDILNKELGEGVGAIKIVTKEIDEANGTLLYEAQAAGYTLYVRGSVADGRYYEVKVSAETEYFEGHRDNILKWMDTFEVVK